MAIEVSGPPVDRSTEVLTPEALDFLAELQRVFGARREELEAALAKGYEKIFTYVRADNDAALRVYLRQGFRIVGTARRHARLEGRYIDEIVIEKMLTHG